MSRLKIDEIIAMIEIELKKDIQGSNVAQSRKNRLEFIKKFLSKNGFPKNIKERFELSLNPFYFQEVNYDDLDPYTKNGELAHLKNIYDIDLAVQTSGQTRDNISEQEYANYVKNFSRINAWRQKQSKPWDKVLLALFKVRTTD